MFHYFLHDCVYFTDWSLNSFVACGKLEAVELSFDFESPLFDFNTSIVFHSFALGMHWDIFQNKQFIPVLLISLLIKMAEVMVVRKAGGGPFQICFENGTKRVVLRMRLKQ